MNRTLRITFLLPGSGRVPQGGKKVVYEYANCLSRRGHQVMVVHAAQGYPDPSFAHLAIGAAKYAARSVNRSFLPEKWFQMDPAVQILWVPSFASRHIPDADIVVATAWHTVERVAGYPASKGHACYLIQSWETWCGPEERVRATWKAPLRKVVIARWLLDIANQLGVECAYIPNGLDQQRFGLDVPIESRNPKHVMMLHHPHPVKGSAEGLQALAIVHRQIPDLQVTLFGTTAANGALPRWATYRRLPTQEILRACYNQAAVFLSPSRVEGWPLPPAEAMLCGAALVATDIGGHREYAVHEDNALLSPARDPERLAQNVLRLVQDVNLRQTLAHRGHKCARQFSWDKSVESFEQVLLGRPAPHSPANYQSGVEIPAQRSHDL